MTEVDNLLIKRLKQDDMSSFDEIYEMSNKSVYYAAYLIFKDEQTSLDIMQETYLQLLNNKDKIPNDVDVVAYLTQIAKNKSINLYNKRKKEKEFLSYLKDASYDKLIHESGLVDTIRRTLNDKEFDTFILKVLGGYSFKEISKIKHIPIGTATWLFQEARKKLEIKLKGVKF